jgi:hypothetical protein
MKYIFPQSREDAKRVKNANDFGLNPSAFKPSQIMLKISFAPLRLKRAARVGVR